MTIQKAPDYLLAHGKNEMMGSVDKSPVESQKDNERRLQRLLSEHDLLKKFINTHLFIHIKEAFGFPPEKYHLVYRVDGLLQAGKSVESKSEHIVEILLPDDYPDAPPVCSMLSRIFHPNISGDRIDIKEQWTPETTLADIVIKIGQMIVFQRYSIKATLNKEAAQWAVQNKKLLPLSTVDFNHGTDASSSGSPAAATAPAGAGRAADFKDAGDPDPIVFEDVAAQLMVNKEEPNEDDTAQFSIEIEAPSVATGEKNGERKIQPAPASLQPAQDVIPQHIATDVKGPIPARTTSIDHVAAPAPYPQKVEPQARSQAKPRFFEPENRPGELRAKERAVFGGPGIFCLNCGNKNIWKANFCTRCGVTLTSMAPQRTARMIIAVCTIVVLLLAAEVEIIVFLVHR
jgi:hypothetical protein